uniref:Uncharacterized protein n=1 Tax=Anguilla anguilla TaxID=7936 RepID=A0A0E9QG43_ANGAN
MLKMSTNIIGRPIYKQSVVVSLNPGALVPCLRDYVTLRETKPNSPD